MTRGYLLPSKSDRKKGNRSQWGVRHLTQDSLGVRAQSIVILNVLGVRDHFSGYSRLALLLRPSLARQPQPAASSGIRCTLSSWQS